MNLSFLLMHLNEEVARVEVNIDMAGVEILDFETTDAKSLPIMIKNIPNKRRAFKIWWFNRLVPPSRREYYNLARSFYQVPFKERPLLTEGMFLISILSYCVSLEDKYWFNPEKDTELYLNKATKSYLNNRIWSKKTFEEVDLFSNKINLDLNKFFIYSKNPNTNNLDYFTPSICLNGNLEKFWDIYDDNFYLMKYMYNISEINLNEVIINEFLTVNYPELSNKVYFFKKKLSDFNIETENDIQFNLVASKCFTDAYTEFVPASEILYATGNSRDSVEELFNEGCQLLNIKDGNLPLLAHEDLKKRFRIEEDRSFDNFGFIRDAKTRTFIKPAPLFGNSYYKYIIRG